MLYAIRCYYESLPQQDVPLDAIHVGSIADETIHTIQLQPESTHASLLHPIHICVDIWNLNVNAFLALSFDRLASLVCDSAPTRCLIYVLDPFGCWEVMVILLHGNDPRDVVKCHGLEAEIYE